MKSRNRTVSKEANYGGNPCEGSSTENPTCNAVDCPGIRYPLKLNCNLMIRTILNLKFSSLPMGTMGSAHFMLKDLWRGRII